LKKGDNKKPVRNDENVQFVQPGEEKIKKGRPVLSGKEVPSHNRIKQTAISTTKKISRKSAPLARLHYSRQAQHNVCFY
jgi:hypothetical protein